MAIKYDPSTVLTVPQQIVNLTALALQDRVLTYKERQTIVIAALDMGVSESAVNKYIDDALQKRLQNYSKEELKHCPTCGAQIPLISDECLFCGSSLVANDGGRRVVKVDSQGVVGYAADIIRSENRKTAEEQQSIKQCPDCGAPFPLVSHICAHCGHVLHEQADSQYNIQQLLNNISTSIRALRSAPKPGFLKILMYNIEVATAFVGSIMLLDVDAEGLCEAKGIFAVCGFILLAAGMFIPMFANRDWKVKKGSEGNAWKVSPIELADQGFYNALTLFDSYTLQINTLYGDNNEAKTKLGYLDTLIKSVKKERTKHRAGVAAVYLGAIALVIIIKYISL